MSCDLSALKQQVAGPKYNYLFCGLISMSATRYDLGPVPSTSLRSISVSSTFHHHGFHMVVSQGFSSRILYAAFIPTSLHTFCLVKPPQPFGFHHSNNTVPSVMLCFVMGKTVPMFQRTVLLPPSPGSRCSKKPFLDCVTMKTYTMT
jgi:hypothetical protein